MDPIRSMLEDVTLADLREWAGDKIYQRGKEYIPCVSELSRTEKGTLVAWVSGSDEYATWVRHEGQGNFNYDCNCPYDYGPCKHAVAVLLAAAGQLKRRKKIPLLDPDGDLYLEAFEMDENDWPNEDTDDIDLVPSSVEPSDREDSQLEKLLADKSRDQLRDLLFELAVEFPEVARKIRKKGQLEAGKVDQLVRSLRKEIRKLTAQDAWHRHWDQRGNLPDYSHVEKQLKALLKNGSADAVLELGEELWSRGIEQVERSNDEGMTAEALSSCLQIVLSALPQTTLSCPKQLLWLAERELEDQFDLLGDVGWIVNDWRYTPLHWREVAVVIEKWLKQLKVQKEQNFSARYQRERTMLWLRDAYMRSKEPHKVIPLLEQEAERCRSYEPLVKALLDAGEIDRARQWCVKGFKQTLKDAPGIASGLQRQLKKLAESEGRFDLVAAYRAQDFFGRPSKEAYLDLRDAAEKIDAWTEIRNGALDYLGTAERPGQGKSTLPWPLPEPEVGNEKTAAPSRVTDFPNWDLLIEIAILEKRLDAALAIYTERPTAQRWGYSVDETLANAVATSHPDVAVEIWRSISERLIGQVKPKAYLEASKYLRKVRKVFEQNKRLEEWSAVINDLRVRHKAKRRLMEVLNELDNNRKLVD